MVRPTASKWKISSMSCLESLKRYSCIQEKRLTPSPSLWIYINITNMQYRRKITNHTKITTNYLQEIRTFIKHNQLTIVQDGYMEEFENEAAKIFGNTFGISTCNGTSSLYLALFCLSLENNKKEIIVPAYGFHAMTSV